MGRPVIHQYSLDEVVVASNYVLLVERAGPERLEAGAARWPLRVLEVLMVNDAVRGHRDRSNMPPLALTPNPGSVVDVLINRTSLTLRRTLEKSSSGASFPAQRYAGDAQVPERPQWFVFVTEDTEGLELTAERSWEDVSRRDEVRAAVGRADQALESRREGRRQLEAMLAQRRKP